MQNGLKIIGICLILIFQSSSIAGPPARFELGMNAHGLIGPKMNKIKEMGATWVRAEVPWYQIEKRPGVFEFEETDAVIRDHYERGFKILFILAYAPSFHSTNGQSNGIPDKPAWQKFVNVMTSRYKDEVDAWEVWNEPNLKEFFVGDARQYVDILLKPAYPIIKKNDPTSVVGAPGLANLYGADFYGFLKKMNQYGAGPYFDVLTHHIYASNPGGIKKMMLESRFQKPSVLKSRIDSKFDKKPFWLTEYGCDEVTVKGETAQANCLVEQTKIFWQISWVEKAFIYNVIDDSRIEDKVRWGVFRSDTTPKIAIPRLKQLMME